MVSFSHIYKVYPGPTYALKDVNFKIKKGEFVFLSGPSGSGKTSLFQLMSAFNRPTAGSIHIDEFDLSQMNSRDISFYRRKIGMIYQDFRLLKNKTIYENVEWPLRIRGDKVSFIQDRVKEILNQIDLSHKIHHFPEQLSGGEQQRVAIARALVHHPILLMADEPTGNLDAHLSENIMDLLELSNAQGTTVFVASHDLDLIQRRQKRVIYIKNGRVLKQK